MLYNYAVQLMVVGHFVPQPHHDGPGHFYPDHFFWNYLSSSTAFFCLPDLCLSASLCCSSNRLLTSSFSMLTLWFWVNDFFSVIVSIISPRASFNNLSFDFAPLYTRLCAFYILESVRFRDYLCVMGW